MPQISELPITEVHIPDFIALSEGLVNDPSPERRKIADESRAWAASFDVFKSRAGQFLLKCELGLLAGFVYPYARDDVARLGADFFLITWIMDDACENDTPEEARRIGGDFVHDIIYPDSENPRSDPGLAAVAVDWGFRFVKMVKPLTHQRFRVWMEKYVDCIVEEAKHKERKEVPSLERYLEWRYWSAGGAASLGLADCLLELDFPDEIREDPRVDGPIRILAEMVTWSNDLHSYNAEVAGGLGRFNLVVVLMNERNYTLQEAVDEIGKMYVELKERYFQGVAELEADGMDPEVIRLIKATSHWPIGYNHWVFDTPRYYGDLRPEIRKTNILPMVTFMHDS